VGLSLFHSFKRQRVAIAIVVVCTPTHAKEKVCAPVRRELFHGSRQHYLSLPLVLSLILISAESSEVCICKAACFIILMHSTPMFNSMSTWPVIKRRSPHSTLFALISDNGSACNKTSSLERKTSYIHCMNWLAYFSECRIVKLQFNLQFFCTLDES
jgi:hypothetical protein